MGYATACDTNGLCWWWGCSPESALSWCTHEAAVGGSRTWAPATQMGFDLAHPQLLKAFGVWTSVWKPNPFSFCLWWLMQTNTLNFVPNFHQYVICVCKCTSHRCTVRIWHPVHLAYVTTQMNKHNTVSPLQALSFPPTSLAIPCPQCWHWITQIELVCFVLCVIY